MNVSPSMIGRLKDCARIPAWIYTRNVTFRDDSHSDARNLGDAAHKIVETWLRTGKEPDLEQTMEIERNGEKEAVYVGAIARAAIMGLVSNGIGPGVPGLEPEAVEAVAERNGARVKTRADVRVSRGVTPEARASGEVPFALICDHKFVRDLGSALSSKPGATNSYGEPSYLGDNVQALALAAGEFAERPEIVSVDLLWHYTQTRASRGIYPTRAVRVSLLREDVERGMRAHLDDKIEALTTIKRLRILPEALSPRGGSCRLFGRPCDYTNHCNLSDEERIRQTMTDPQQSAAAMLAEIQAIAARTAVGGAAAPPPPPPPPPASAGPAKPDNVRAGQVWETGRGASLERAQVLGFDAPDGDFPAGSVRLRTTDGTIIRTTLAIMLTNPLWIFVDEGTLIGVDGLNPPEAARNPNDGSGGPPAPPKRDDAPSAASSRYAGLDRDAAKKLAVERGLLPANARHGLASIVGLLETWDLEHPGEADAIVAQAPAAAIDATPAPTQAPSLDVDALLSMRASVTAARDAADRALDLIDRLLPPA